MCIRNRPRIITELDYLSGEFIHFLYQDDRPVGWASDFLCGLKRLYPFCRRGSESANQYQRNRVKAIVRRRACPLPWSVVKGMVGLAILENRHDLAIALYLGFAGMFRASELCFLKLAHINVIGPFSAIISLRESKTAVRMANAEAVVIKDSCLVSLLKCRISHGKPNDALIGVRYTELSTIIKDYASFVRCFSPTCESS